MKRFLLLVSFPIALVAMLCVQAAVAATPAAPASAPSTQPQRASLADALAGHGSLTVDQFWDAEFWKQAMNQLTIAVISYIPRVVVAVLLFCLFYVVYRISRKLALGSMKAAGIDESIRDMLGRALKMLILGFGLVIAGNQVGIEIAALLTGVSIIGLAVGFAAQESISNFIAGVMIFLDKPFKAGDWILIDNHICQVKRITFRSTRLTDLDGDMVVYPNKMMLDRKVVNKSINRLTRCNVTIPLPADRSIEQARGVLLGLASRDARIDKGTPPEVIVKDLDASGSVTLLLHFWIREERYEDAMTYEYLERAKLALEAVEDAQKRAA